MCPVSGSCASGPVCRPIRSAPSSPGDSAPPGQSEHRRGGKGVPEDPDGGTYAPGAQQARDKAEVEACPDEVVGRPQACTVARAPFPGGRRSVGRLETARFGNEGRAARAPGSRSRVVVGLALFQRRHGSDSCLPSGGTSSAACAPTMDQSPPRAGARRRARRRTPRCRPGRDPSGPRTSQRGGFGRRSAATSTHRVGRDWISRRGPSMPSRSRPPRRGRMREIVAAEEKSRVSHAGVRLTAERSSRSEPTFARASIRTTSSTIDDIPSRGRTAGRSNAGRAARCC